MTLLLFTACGQGQMKTPENALTKFEEFKKVTIKFKSPI